MRLFLSWSGQRSEHVARALREFLPVVLQALEPWSAIPDIEAGARWTTNIDYALSRSEFAIVCVTPENLSSPWIHYEIGALSSSLGAPRICPYLIGFRPSDLTGPLVQFQAVEADREGTWRLIKTLNHLLEDKGLLEETLRSAFDAWWPRLAKEISAALSERVSQVSDLPSPSAQNSDRELLEEILRRLSAGPVIPARETQVDQAPVFVFLVHGRAHGTAETIARFIEKLGPRVVILHEQPNEGRTVIEKFEDHSDVAFAIVLMTGDDRGGLSSADWAQQKPRARQNVVFELGYFIAKLGRRYVVVLYEEGVELPSDYSGVVYLPLDSAGAWRLNIARELRAAGFRVDLNNAL